MIVCVCHRVSDRDIARAAHDGCASFDELQFELGVATACGKCHDCARETFDHHAALARAGAGAPATVAPIRMIARAAHGPRDAMAAATP